MEMIEMCVTHKHVIDGRQIAQADARAALPFEDDQPAREIGIDYEIVSGDLNKEAAMTDEGQPKFPLADEMRFMRAASAGRNRRTPYQRSELFCLSANGEVQHQPLLLRRMLQQKRCAVRWFAEQKG